MRIVTFTELREHLKSIMDQSADDYEPVVIKRSKGENMILLSQSDYESLKETAYLMGSEANAKHIKKSLDQANQGKLIHKKLDD